MVDTRSWLCIRQQLSSALQIQYKEIAYLRGYWPIIVNSSKIHLAGLIVALTFVHAESWAQPVSFGFLSIPQSSHEAALGGHIVSLREADPALSFSNPAAVTSIESRSLGVSLATWISRSINTGVTYSDRIRERSVFCVSARHLNYGVSDETDRAGNVTGTFNSRDIVVQGTYGYRLGDRMSGGATIKTVYSRYGSYSSVAIAADMGILFTSASDLLSFGISFTDMGGQVKAFQDEREKLPFNITAGLTWQLEHAPIRLSFTFDRLHEWDADDFYVPEGDLKLTELLFRHIGIGADFLVTDQLYVALGCNLRNRAELAYEGRKGLAGISLGTGIRLKRMSFGLAYSRINVASSSLFLNFVTNI